MPFASSTQQALPYVVDFNPIFISIGPIDIHWYGVTYLLGFGLFYLMGRYRIHRYQTGWDKQQLSDFIFYGALGVVLGGRIGWYLFYNDTSFGNDPWLLFKIWEGGMSFHGGLMGVILAMVYFKNKTNKTFYQVSDFVAPLAPLGIASVRIGNFINGELWGRLTTHTWGMIFPKSMPYNKQVDVIGVESWQQLYQQGQLNLYARHPSPLYEAFLEGIVTFVVVWVAAHFARKRGTASAAFLLSYGVSRFCVEFYRQPDANRGFIAFDWMTMGHVLTLPIIAYGLWILWAQRNSKQL